MRRKGGSNKQPPIPTCVQQCDNYDLHAHSTHLVPQELHSLVQVHQSQTKVRQTQRQLSLKIRGAFKLASPRPMHHLL